MLFEVYFERSDIEARKQEALAPLVGIAVQAPLLVLALAVPVIWVLARRLSRTAAEREGLLRRSMDASQGRLRPRPLARSRQRDRDPAHQRGGVGRSPGPHVVVRLRADRGCARGRSPIHPRVARQLLGARSTAGAPADLSPREAEVLGLVREGLANKQIPRRLGTTERTVKAHLTSVFARIGVVDRTQAALWAEPHGL